MSRVADVAIFGTDLVFRSHKIALPISSSEAKFVLLRDHDRDRLLHRRRNIVIMIPMVRSVRLLR